ncbi:MAG: hypothetical protein AB1705_12630 [Verrucomicrobiota bacterium]
MRLLFALWAVAMMILVLSMVNNLTLRDTTPKTSDATGTVKRVPRPPTGNTAFVARQTASQRPVRPQPAPFTEEDAEPIVAVENPPAETAPRAVATPVAPATQAGGVGSTMRRYVDISQSDQTGNGIAGRVFLEGTPPPEKPLPLDPNCGKLYSEVKPTTTFFVVSRDRGLGDVFVLVERETGIPSRQLPPARNPVPVLLDQVGCVFTPYVFGIQVGQKLRVRNSDPVLHNVHLAPAVAGNAERNRASLPGAPDMEFTFAKPEMFLRIKCDVHPWMFAYACVVPHSYFAVTDANGNYEIPDVPPGRYTVRILHRKTAKLEVAVSVVKDRVTKLNAKLPLSLDLVQANR